MRNRYRAIRIPQKYGVHKSCTIGDFRERIKDLGVLIGYNVIEVDKKVT